MNQVSMFDRQKFQQIFQHQCPETAIALHHYEVLESTNSTARQLLDNGASFPLVVIADRQTAGRGQWGRQWQSDRGGLYLSLGMATDEKIGILLTFCSGWGIAIALRQRGIPVQLKWPNDLILDGKKLGGIKTVTTSTSLSASSHQRWAEAVERSQNELAEASPVTSDGLRPLSKAETSLPKHHPSPIRDRSFSPLSPPSPSSQAIIGVGINWKNQPPEPGIALGEFLNDRIAISNLESLAAITTCGILSGYRYYLSEGTDALLSSYWDLAIAKERSVTIDGSLGTIVGITPRGELRIRLQSPGASTEIHCPPGAIALGYNAKD